MVYLRFVSATVLVLILSVCAIHAQSEMRSLCVAPNAGETPQRCGGAPGLCNGGAISLRIDKQPVQPWPKAKCMKIEGLGTVTRPRVVVYRAGKAQQSFTFRFSEFKFPTPCLFLNDLYWTAQLWEANQAPWCKCN
jgi:hypothetical protein